MKFNSVLEDVTVYEAGKPIELVVREYGIDAKDVIKLASNENPYGTSNRVISQLKNSADLVSLYPDDSMFELKALLASTFDVNRSQIIVGAGSDQVIDFCVKAKCQENSTVLMSKTTFAMYEIYAKQVGARILKTSDDQHNLEQFLDLYQRHGADIIFLCLPNNPLGECLDAGDVYGFLDQIDDSTLVVLDGAYQEYASFKEPKKSLSPSYIISHYSNVVYMGTFSKAYGLGGLRVGYGIAQNDIIESLSKLRPPFNITTLSLLAAIEALKDQGFIHSSVENNFIQMQRYEAYAMRKGFEFIPSYTNFIIQKRGDVREEL